MALRASYLFWIVPILTLLSAATGVECRSADGAEPFEFVAAYDAGLDPRAATDSWIRSFHHSDQWITGSPMCFALFTLRLDDKTGQLLPVHTIQEGGMPRGFRAREADFVRNVLRFPSDGVISPDDRHVYTCNRERTTPMVFQRDLKTGAITHEPSTEEQIQEGARLPSLSALAISRDGKSFFACGSDTVVVYDRDVDTGQLKVVQVLEDDAKGEGEKGEKYEKIAGAVIVQKLGGPTSVFLSADDRFVYVLCRRDMAVSVFSRDSTNHRLSLLQSVYDEKEKSIQWIEPYHGMSMVQAFSMSPDGENLYVASLDDGGVFSRDPKTGKLTFLERLVGKGDPDAKTVPPRRVFIRDLCVSPDGKQVYQVSQGRNSIWVYERDTAHQGRLKILTSLSSAKFPAARLNGLSSVRISRDGKFILAASSEALVNVFRRVEAR
ncbi:MAG: lactonase family protein [Planctomycetales bacterium]|nr:lactonase family protein [Planctomycetales bacterium]